MGIEDWLFMESCPRRSAEPLTSFSKGDSPCSVTGTDGVLDRAKCLAGRARPPLRSGDRVVGQ
jgi:hypothetical protein